ncbi:MAG: IS1182 family transposase [Pseudomonadales bacterium]|nr:IS1182 family transposase [Pseudomonadales bacterium]
MNFIEGTDRREAELLPACLDDYVAVESPVRKIDSFVESLDLHDCGFRFPKSNTQGKGRPAYHPKFLLKLFIYGYMNGLRSGRKLEKACKINLEVIWLMQKLKPDFKTICDFRKNNSDSFKKVATQYSLHCYHQGYIGGELLAVDGSRIKGQNALDKSWSKKKVNRLKLHLEKEISNYLKLLEDADNCPVPSDEKLHNYANTQIENLESRIDDLKQIEAKLEESGSDHLSQSDADTRILKKNGNIVVGYNAQTAVDSRHGLIVCSEATNKQNDFGLLAPMSIQAKEILSLDETEVTADKGYYSSECLKQCDENNIITHIPEIMMSPSERQGLFGKRHFEFNEERNVYICPANQELTTPDTGKKKQWNYRNKIACKNCPIKERCTTSNYRTIKRSVNDPYIEKNRERLSYNKDIRRLRKVIVEPPFSWLKMHSLVGGFLTKGFKMVNAELSLAQLAYNMKRVEKIESRYRRGLLSYFFKETAHNHENRAQIGLFRAA